MDLFKQLSDGVKAGVDMTQGAVKGAVDLSKQGIDGAMDLTSKGTGMVAGPLGDVANATVMKIPGADAVKEAGEKGLKSATDLTASAVGTTLDATKGGLGVVMAGANGVFDTVGVNAGFQVSKS